MAILQAARLDQQCSTRGPAWAFAFLESIHNKIFSRWFRDFDAPFFPEDYRQPHYVLFLQEKGEGRGSSTVAYQFLHNASCVSPYPDHSRMHCRRTIAH